MESGLIKQRRDIQKWLAHPNMLKRVRLRGRLRDWKRSRKRRARKRIKQQQQEWLPICEEVIESLGVKPRPTPAPTPLATVTKGTAVPIRTPDALLPGPSENFEPLRINSGDFFPHSDSSGNLWLEDKYFQGISDDFQTKREVNNTSEQQLYMTERYGPAFSYAIPVEEQPASYRVVLHLAEIFWWKAGQRVFDIYIEDKLVIENIDLLKEYGEFNPKAFEYTVNVDDGQVNIDFYADVQFCKINGIEVLPGS